ncbi:MAG TPA: ATP-binding protein [Kofleriaceae bacterium]|nr:ATP-binding protein [Kofleriaceae bacterium]
MSDLVLQDVIDGLEVLICGLDDEGKIQVFNRPCERVTGILREDAVGLSWIELFASGQRTEHVKSLWQQARQDEPAGPFVALCRNNRNLRWHFARHVRERPTVIVVWAVGLDVTSEREALARARELERMVMLGNLVSGLTHELRNPLNGALLQLTVADRMVARRHDETMEPIAAAIARAAAEMRRISSILDDFLVFVRPQPLRLERVDVRQIVARAVERSASRATPAGVTVAIEPGDAALAEIDASRVERAVYHLVANAIDATAEAGEHEVRVTIAATGNAIAIEIEDRGAGLPSADTPVFEPFFTTKKGGTGLGLAIVQRVAADHGGEVAYLRRDGATVFRMELPIVAGIAN